MILTYIVTLESNSSDINTHSDKRVITMIVLILIVIVTQSVTQECTGGDSDKFSGTPQLCCTSAWVVK